MPFEFKPTPLSGLQVIQPRLFRDERGFFKETYKKSEFFANGISEEFHQDNHSFSSLGTLRGLHFQTKEYAQGKLVQVIKGAVWDVAVDLRVDSPTFKEWYGIELTEENNTMVYLPPGFGHGFLTLAEETHFLYKCTAEYNFEADGGVLYNDPDLGIDWPFELLGISSEQGVKLSEKDRKLPRLKEIQVRDLS